MPQTIEWLVERAALTTQALADNSGLPIERVEAVLSGRWLPSPSERAKLARALGVLPEDVTWGHTMSPRNVRYHRFGFHDGDTTQPG